MLWLPKEMELGDLYARLTRQLAICLVYAPLDPCLFALALLMLACNFWAVRYAISHWFRKPANVVFSLSDRMRAVLAGLLFFYVGFVYVSTRAAAASTAGRDAVVLPCIITLGVLCGWYVLYVFASRRVVGAFDELADAERNGDDTAGVRYEHVRGIEEYACPYDRRGTVEALEAECFRHTGPCPACTTSE